jgi:hypothetical protein
MQALETGILRHAVRFGGPTARKDGLDLVVTFTFPLTGPEEVIGTAVVEIRGRRGFGRVVDFSSPQVLVVGKRLDGTQHHLSDEDARHFAHVAAIAIEELCKLCQCGQPKDACDCCSECSGRGCKTCNDVGYRKEHT